jgi:hypothetical protein
MEMLGKEYFSDRTTRNRSWNELGAESVGSSVPLDHDGVLAGLVDPIDLVN